MYLVSMCMLLTNNVSVFTTERDHVTSFGQIENKEDEFNYSRCISGDVDNFMLIINSSFLIC